MAAQEQGCPSPPNHYPKYLTFVPGTKLQTLPQIGITYLSWPMENLAPVIKHLVL